ncbi:hypothetical protein M2447_001040 [Ereboglobus sp. PH5-10]|uniref:hypothetical protein n=1 Tax=Ereboglobus sp. PH5-10 TaxID=2940629 RepID=UPI0024053754|nr:hypothetical protein [Ereboglobus sp. PH5-10]MDF9826955.1 hypothetical protein [Ereboglobus sp. PH5-10]
MALNQGEQQLLDYIRANPEEKSYWEQKVRSVAAAQPDDYLTAEALGRELRAYLVERARVVRQLEDVSTGMSMRNLAEYLILIWTEPRPKKKKAGDQFTLWRDDAQF